MTSARLLCYASFLLDFKYTNQFKNEKENINVDCVSHVSIPQNDETFHSKMIEEENHFYSELINQISNAVRH